MEFETFKVIATTLGIFEFEFEYNDRKYFFGYSDKKDYIIADIDNIIVRMGSVSNLIDYQAFDGKSLEEIWYSISNVYWDGMGDADNWYNQLIGDNLFELLYIVSQNRAIKIDFYGILHKLFVMEKDDKIVLYAGTYSLSKAIEKVDIEVASFYIYEKLHRIGFHLYVNRMGSSFTLDKDIFKFKHRHLYNKNHLSNRFFGEADQRTGEHFKNTFLMKLRNLIKKSRV